MFKMSKLIAVIIVFVAMIFAGGSALAEDSRLNVEVSRKLEKIIENQNQILDRLNAIEEEMRIIKIRATRA